MLGVLPQWAVLVMQLGNALSCSHWDARVHSFVFVWRKQAAKLFLIGKVWFQTICLSRSKAEPRLCPAGGNRDKSTKCSINKNINNQLQPTVVKLNSKGLEFLCSAEILISPENFFSCSFFLWGMVENSPMQRWKPPRGHCAGGRTLHWTSYTRTSDLIFMFRRKPTLCDRRDYTHDAQYNLTYSSSRMQMQAPRCRWSRRWCPTAERGGGLAALWGMLKVVVAGC